MNNDVTQQKRELRALTETMIEIAIRGTQKSDNEPLILMYCLILDCAHRIRQTMAENFLEH
jgi:hypothetical protein